MRTSSYNEWCLVCKSSHPKTPPPLLCRTWKKNKLPAAVHINGYENGPDESALRSPPPFALTPGPVPVSAPYIISAMPTLLDSKNLLASGGGCHSTVPHLFHLTFCTSLTDATVHRSSPQAQRRDIGLAVTHRSAAIPDLFRLLVMLCHRCLRGRLCIKFILLLYGRKSSNINRLHFNLQRLALFPSSWVCQEIQWPTHPNVDTLSSFFFVGLFEHVNNHPNYEARCQVAGLSTPQFLRNMAANRE